MSFNGWWAYKLWLKHIIFDSINVNSSNSVSGSLIITHLPLFLHFCIFLSHFDLVSVVLVVVARFAQPARVMGLINVLAFVSSLLITSTMVARVAHVACTMNAIQMWAHSEVEHVLQQLVEELDTLVIQVKAQFIIIVKVRFQESQLLSSNRLLKWHRHISLLSLEANVAMLLEHIHRWLWIEKLLRQLFNLLEVLFRSNLRLLNVLIIN